MGKHAEKIVKHKVVDLIELRTFQPVALRDQLSKYTLCSQYCLFNYVALISRYEALVKASL